MTDVPLIDLKAQYATIRDETRAAIDRVLESQRFILGEEVRAFETELAAFVGAKHAIGVSSGTDALTVALMAAGVDAGSEVITTPFTFLSTVECVVRLGATPVYVDLAPGSFHLDVERIERAITRKTRAILPVHLFGGCAPLASISAVARARGISVIEDAAQSLGASFAAQVAGTFGQMSAFSFFPSKNLGAYGDAGAVLTSDDALATRVGELRSHGQSARYVAERVGGNFRLDELQAAILRVKLRHLRAWNDARRANAHRYASRLDDTAAHSDGRLVLPQSSANEHHVFHHYVVRSNRRDALRVHLRTRGIATEVHYPLPMHQQPAWREDIELPHAEGASREVLSLPVHADLRPDQIDAVVTAIQSFLVENR